MPTSQPPASAGSEPITPRYRGLALDHDGTVAYAGNGADATLDVLRELAHSGCKPIPSTGRELGVNFDKCAAMVLPTNMNKASGLDQALCEHGLAAHRIAALGST